MWLMQTGLCGDRATFSLGPRRRLSAVYYNNVAERESAGGVGGCELDGDKHEAWHAAALAAAAADRGSGPAGRV